MPTREHASHRRRRDRRITSTVIATRGERLALTRLRFSDSDQRLEVDADVLGIVEIDADDRIAARFAFDLDDIDAAFEELDARYLAGEAAAHAHTWSVVEEVFAAFNRRELPATTPDWIYIDHRRGIRAGRRIPYLRAVVGPRAGPQHLHRGRASADRPRCGRHLRGVRDLGRGLRRRVANDHILTVEGDLINRCEIFDEADLDAALARFDELERPTPTLENAAIRTWERLADAFNRRDVDSLLAVITAGMADSKTAERACEIRASAQRPCMRCSSAHSWRMKIGANRHKGISPRADPREFRDTGDVDRPITVEYVTVDEVSDDDLMHDTVVFDPDDIDAAFAELDARYVAGEAADYAQTWSVIAQRLRRAQPARGAPNDVGLGQSRSSTRDSFRAWRHDRLHPCAWDVEPDVTVHIEAVHRLSDRGAVVTHVVRGPRSRVRRRVAKIVLLTVKGDAVSRGELFDETDLDTALARFDEINRPAPAVENASTRAWARLTEAFNRRDVNGFIALTTADGRLDDRRKGLHSVLDGPARQNNFHQLLELTPSPWRMEVEPIAIRGSRLSLIRGCLRDYADTDSPITLELLTVMEVSNGGLMHDTVNFDPDDLDAAFAELDVRYLAGEAAAYSRTWSLIAQTYAAFNRHELSRTSPDWVNLDHRRGIASAPATCWRMSVPCGRSHRTSPPTLRPCIG